MAKATDRTADAPSRRFRPYPEYRDSGVEWLGGIPAHWEPARLWRLCSATSGATPIKENPEYWNGEVPWVSPKDMKRRVISTSEDLITQQALEETGIKLIAPQVVLVVVRGMILAHSFPVAVTSAPVTINQDMKALRLIDGIDTFYFAWALDGLARGITATVVEEAAHGTRAIRMNEWRSLVVPLPPYPEQKAIAAFLDRETAKIDVLVARKERLIELLQEKRTALITRAVTRGLDPNIPMKDSGVEWLGEIPAHWNLRPLKRVSPEITVGVVVNPSTYVRTDGVPFLYGGDIQEGRIIPDVARRMSEEDSRALSKSCLRAGDLVCVRVGAPGVTAVVSPELAGANCASVLIVRHVESFESRWLCFAMNSRSVRYQVELVQYGAAQEQFNVAHAVEFFVPLAPQEEQKAIAAFLDRETSKINILAKRIWTAIDLLREFRAALISAAITGKIDVRKGVPR